MQIADLYVNLGIKGSEKTVGALADTKKGLGDIASTSLEAKAAIVGLMYALEQLFSKSGKVGTNLTNFGALFGDHAKQTLQVYQYAAQQAGVAADSVQSAFESVSSMATKILTRQATPSGLADISLKTGISYKDLQDSQNNPEILLQKYQEYFAKMKAIGREGLAKQNLESMGVGKDVMAALARNAFNPTALADAQKHVYSDKEIAQLDKANIAWTNLFTKMEMTIGHINAKFGPGLVKNISGIADKVGELVSKLLVLSEKVNLFGALTKVFDGWKLIFDGIIKGVDALNELDQKSEKKKEAEEAAPLHMSDIANAIQEFLPESKGGELPSGPGMGPVITNPFGIKENPGDIDRTIPKHATKQDVLELLQTIVEFIDLRNYRKTPGGATVIPIRKTPNPGVLPTAQKGAVNPPIPPKVETGNPQASVTVSPTFNFNQDVNDPKKTADAAQRGISQAFYSIPALTQIS